MKCEVGEYAVEKLAGEVGLADEEKIEEASAFLVHLSPSFPGQLEDALFDKVLPPSHRVSSCFQSLIPGVNSICKSLKELGVFHNFRRYFELGFGSWSYFSVMEIGEGENQSLAQVVGEGNRVVFSFYS